MLAILNIWNVTTALIYLYLLRRRLAYISDKQQEHVVVGFVVAGLYSVGLVLFLYGMYPVRLEAVFSTWDLAYHVLVVGVVEESAKFLVFLFLVHVIGLRRLRRSRSYTGSSTLPPAISRWRYS